jgi:hypothetical protein
VYGRKTPCYRSPERLARDVYELHRYRGDPVYVPCDITQPGMDYAYRFLQAMRGFQAQVCLDLTRPMPRKFLQDLVGALPHVALQIGMGSHDSRIREAAGRNYSNAAIEQMFSDALSLGCERIDVHFTIGLPYQDYASVMETVAYCDDLLTRLSRDGRLQPFIAPMVPFLDPGSIAFEESEKNGYHLKFRTLEEHRRALLAPTWKYVLNYETSWMSADDIVRATYDAAVGMAHLRAKHGLLDETAVNSLEELVDETRRLMAEIEQAMALNDFDQLQDTLRALKPDIDQVNHAGPWNDFTVVPTGKYARRPMDLRGGGRSGTSPNVWGLLKDWLGRRYYASRALVSRRLHRSDSQRQTGTFS